LGDRSIKFDQSGPSGFDIIIFCAGGDIACDFGGLKQDFSTLDEALNWAERGLTSECRLRIESCGGRPYRWTLERILSDREIVEFTASAPLTVLDWLRKKTVRYLQNT
jgi:hypothetical protein